MDTTYTKWSDLRGKIEQELDLNEETFVTLPELIQYANSAIDEAEKMVLELYQDYFLTPWQPTLVNGTAGYTLPATIWGNKIRLAYYTTAGDTQPTYKISRIPLHETMYVSPMDDYRFMITQAPPQTTDGPVDGGIRFQLFPPSRESGTPITVFYIRHANRIVDDGSQIDIPEATAFIEWYIRVKVYRKEGHFLLQDAEAELEKQRQFLRESLDQMSPDETELITGDMSFYYEFYTNGYNGSGF